jgi:hypothetical protein
MIIPVIRHCAERHSRHTEGQRRGHDDQAHGFVQDPGSQCPKTEHADQERQTELCAAKAYQTGITPVSWRVAGLGSD